MSAAPQQPPPSLHFVVIEDDTMMRRLLTLALTKAFPTARIQSFRDGTSALAQCRVQAPDVAVVDLGLPDMDGRTLVRTLKADFPSTRVFVLTGEFSPGLLAEMAALGVAGCGAKGGDIRTFTEALRAALVA